MDKKKEMKLHKSRQGFYGGENYVLYKILPRTKKLVKKPVKQFTLGELEDKQNKKYKKSDYKEINDYIKNNEITIVNKDEFKWLE